ncbi:MAG TPA: TIM barrel protein [Verrucomicrobiae bacterium]|jgi:signal transduction histidine kinase/sugar phosphate isomerase/epimerase
MMRLGFETVLWGRRIDDLDHLLEVLSACGYEGVEFGQSHRDIYIRVHGRAQPIGTFQKLKERLDRHKLELIGLVGGTLAERKAFCGADRSAYLYIDAWTRECDEALADSSPFTLALHPHWFLPLRRIKDADDILREKGHSHLKLVVDTAHNFIAEDDPVAAVENHFSELASVHIKNWKPDFGRWSHRYANGFCPPSEGIVPTTEVMEKLHSLNYGGWVIMEQDHFEISRERTALICAEWAANWAGKCFRKFKPDKPQVLVFEKKFHETAFQEIKHHAQDALIASELASAPTRGPDYFYPLAAKLFRRDFQAAALKLWSYNHQTEQFCLLAASMAESLPNDCSVLQGRRSSLLGPVVDASRPTIHDLSDPATQTVFGGRDKDFRDVVLARNVHWMLTVPVFNSANPHHLRYLMTAYVERDPRVRGADGRPSPPLGSPPVETPNKTVSYPPCWDLSEDERRAAEHNASLLAVWADYLTDEMCSAAAGATSHLCGEHKAGVNSFVTALLNFLVKRFDCENATLFLVDDSRTRLEPAGDTEERIEWLPQFPKGQRFYTKQDGMTGKTWRERAMVLTTDSGTAKGHAKNSRTGKDEGKRRELLTAPLARRGGELLGVVRLHNKHPRQHAPSATAFTDDDAAKLDAVVQVALPHLDLLIMQRRQAFALTRMAHELQNPLIGIRGAADWLRERLKEQGIKDLKAYLGADYVDDILSYQELMSRLVQSADLFGATIGELKPNVQRVELATSVVMPVVKQLRPLLKKNSLSENRIHVAQFQGTIPWLEVDRLMFQQVFFNLFVNAIKYHDGADSFRLRVKVGVEGDPKKPEHYIIEIEDDGIGLDVAEKDGEAMFLPGVRGANVTQFKDATGTGVGLAVVRAVIDAHCGSVRFTSLRKPTCVTIKLPGALRQMSPKLIRTMQKRT